LREHRDTYGREARVEEVVPVGAQLLDVLDELGVELFVGGLPHVVVGLGLQNNPKVRKRRK
jgi:hypothetical protein